MTYIGNTFIRVWEQFLGLFLPPKGFLISAKGEFSPIENPSEDLVAFAKKHSYFASKSPLISKVTKEPGDLAHIQKILYQMESVPEPAVAEVLTKALAYRTLKEGVEVEVPLNGSFHKYRLDRIFDLWQHIPAFGFVSESASPILLFRGTQFSPFIQSGRASIVADLDPKGPGYDLYQSSRDNIVSWLKSQDRPARVMGYSLGAALASYALILDTPHFSKTENSYLFHPPGVPPHLLHRFEELTEPPACHSFVCLGDIVSKIGRLFGKTTLLRPYKLLPPITAHTSLLFARPRLTVANVDNRKENRCDFRHHYTIIHRSTSRLCYPLGKKLFLKREPVKK